MDNEFNTQILNILICPISNTKLQFNKKENILISKDLKFSYKFKNGIPIILANKAKKLTHPLQN